MVQHEHGTRSRYGAGCRCRRCKKAWREYVTERRRAKGRPDRETSSVLRDVRLTRAIVDKAIDEEADPEFDVSVSTLAGRILVSIQETTGRPRGVVIDELLRAYGPELMRE